MTTGIIPSSMQGKGGKRLNRNNSSIKSKSLIKINCFPTKNPKTKSASPNIPCSSQFGLGLPISARPSRSVGGGRRPPVRMETLGVAPSKFIFGLTTPCRSAPSDTPLRGGTNQPGDRRGGLCELRVGPFFLHPPLQKRGSFERDPNSYDGSRRR